MNPAACRVYTPGLKREEEDKVTVGPFNLAAPPSPAPGGRRQAIGSTQQKLQIEFK
jgi:hypothetical protein